MLPAGYNAGTKGGRGMSDEEREGRAAAADPAATAADNPYPAADRLRHRRWLVGFGNAREEPRLRALVRGLLAGGREGSEP